MAPCRCVPRAPDLPSRQRRRETCAAPRWLRRALLPATIYRRVISVGGQLHRLDRLMILETGIGLPTLRTPPRVGYNTWAGVCTGQENPGRSETNVPACSLSPLLCGEERKEGVRKRDVVSGRLQARRLCAAARPVAVLGTARYVAGSPLLFGYTGSPAVGPKLPGTVV